MNVKDFEDILEAQIVRVQDVLVAKAAEYATEDRLANFKKVAHLRKVTLAQAVSGLMAKHTVSVYDMAESGKTFPIEVWDEKITDHINYLILLRAVLAEGRESVVTPEEFNPEGFNPPTFDSREKRTT